MSGRNSDEELTVIFPFKYRGSSDIGGKKKKKKKKRKARCRYPPISLLFERKVGHDLLATCSAAVAVCDELGRLLLVKLADTGTWLFPGGAIDPDELPADAAVRECYEETGLLVRADQTDRRFRGP